MSAVKLYFDEDAAETAIVSALRDHGIDVVTVLDAELLASADEDQLRFAASVGRAIYSLNVSDFARLHRELLAQGEEHAGVIVIPRQRYSIGDKIRRLHDFVANNDAESIRNTITFL